MDVVDAIKTRRSVRAWTDEEVPKEIVDQILDAGRWSPSPLNSQPWHFVVVRNKSTIEELSKEAKEGAFLKNAKVVITVCVERKVASETDKQNSQRMELIDWLARHEQYTYSAAFAMQNMWLTAWELGVGVCCVTLDRESAYRLLEIPKDQEIIASLAVGNILGNPVPHKDSDRKPLGEIVYFEKYGVRSRNENS